MTQLTLFPKKKTKSNYYKRFYAKQIREAKEKKEEPKVFCVPPIGLSIFNNIAL